MNTVLITMEQCGNLLTNGDFFCQTCGSKKAGRSCYNARPSTTTNEKELVEYYFNQNFQYNAIVMFLQIYHGIVISIRTLKRRLQHYGSKRRASNISSDALHVIITMEVHNGPYAMKGYRGMWHHLRTSYGISVKRDTVMEMLREIDPEGTAVRRARRLHRRKYHSLGPNHCWHIDGHHKLKPYGLPIHGCVDGFSRKILWLKVARTDNNPLVPAYYFLDIVKNTGYCPQKLRPDCGTENGIMADSQCFLSNNSNGHSYGSSPSNQRIENWWSHCKRTFTTWIIDFFQRMVDDGILIPGHDVHMECVWFVFAQLLQTQLDEVTYAWNTHYIRCSRHDTVPGVPDVLYHISQLSGYMDKKITVSQNRLNKLLNQTGVIYEAMQIIEGRDEELEEFFHHVISTEQLLYPPKNWNDGRNLFEAIIQRCI